MKLNRQLLRARRMELGLTSREVARAANVSQPLIKRLEDTGDAAVLQVSTLTMILSALCLDLIEVQEKSPETCEENDLVAAIGGLLQERRSGTTLIEIASSLGVTIDLIDPALNSLDDALRHAGLRIRRNTSGVSIVPIVRASLGSESLQERLRYLSNLNSGDLVLLYRAMTTRLPANTVSATTNGNVNLQKLEGAGLVEIRDGYLCLTQAARTAIEG
jgi:transcriptional regulator with XRE-family HTH domain